MKRLAREEGGFTLVEVLVTSMIMVLVLFAMYSIFDMSLRVFAFGNDETEAVENARLGMERMEREIRAAYPYTKLDGVEANNILFPAFGADPSNPVNPNPSSSVTFANDLDGDRQVETDAATEQITYDLSGGTLRRNGQPVSEFVEPNGFTVTYCRTVNDCPPSAEISEGQVRLVRIELQARVQRGQQAGTQTLTTDVTLRNRSN